MTSLCDGMALGYSLVFCLSLSLAVCRHAPSRTIQPRVNPLIEPERDKVVRSNGGSDCCIIYSEQKSILVA